MTLGVETKRPVVVNDEIKIRDVMMVNITLDNRFVDGLKATRVNQKFIKYLADPSKCEET
jgi:pyruvate/2-oxoglutarate dehydrogenase complex dihydrolipoamide acyltransferase (E2) component